MCSYFELISHTPFQMNNQMTTSASVTKSTSDSPTSPQSSASSLTKTDLTFMATHVMSGSQNKADQATVEAMIRKDENARLKEWRAQVGPATVAKGGRYAQYQ